MKSFLADLHIHTCLSPCAAEEMIPPTIVQAAGKQGLSLIAVCDHNAAGNARAVQEAAREAAGPTVIAGIEITTAEEVHVVGLFPNAEAAIAAAEQVQASLPVADEAYYQRFGAQQVTDGKGCVLRMESRMLATASNLDLSAAVGLIHRLGGAAVAAHVNRPSFSVLSQLGFLPEDAGFDAIEVFLPCDADPQAASATAAKLARYHLPILCSSDSHFPTDIGRARTMCEMQEPTFEELVLALRGVKGRNVRPGGP